MCRGGSGSSVGWRVVEGGALSGSSGSRSDVRAPEKLADVTAGAAAILVGGRWWWISAGGVVDLA